MEISETTFQKDVIDYSHTKPVLVDFWAPWCGPCKMLGPALEQVESEMNGRFRLVKINTDQNPGISQAFQISSIPTVILFAGGQPVDQFAGALPPAEIKKFLEKHIPDPELDKLSALAASDPSAAADAILTGSKKGEKAEDILWLAVTSMLEKGGTLKTLQPYLDHFPKYGSKYSDNIKYLKDFLGKDIPGTDRQIFAGLFNPQTQEKTLEHFYKRVEDAGDNRDSCKDDLITCFFILGNSNPLVNEYRRKLSRILF